MHENGESVSENEFSQAQYPCFSPSNFSMGIEQLGLNIDNLSSHIPTQYIQEMGHDLNNSLPYEMPYTSFSTQNTNSQEENLPFIDMQNGHHSYLNAASLSEFMSIYPQSLLTKSASPFMNQQLNPENLMLGSEFLESNVYGNDSSLIGGGAERDVWEYEIGEGSNKVGFKGKGIITKTKEKIRKEQVNDEYQALRNLLPNPDKMQRSGLAPDVVSYALLVSAYGKARREEEALAVFEEMLDAGVRSQRKKLCLDQKKKMHENGESVSENEFSQAHPCFSPSNFSMGIEQLGLNIDNLSSHIPTQYIQEMGHDLNNSLPYEMPYTSFSTQNTNSQEENLPFIDMQNGHHSYLNAASLSEFMSIYPQSLLTKSASPFMNQQLNPENLMLGSEFLESNVYGNDSSLIGGGAERDVWEYEIGEGSNKVGFKGKGIITKTKEKIRKEQVNDEYQALRNLLPNPDKSDKASIIGETIDHIKELLKTNSELRLLLEQKIHSREKNKRQKKTHDAEDESYNIKLELHDGSSTLRSSWLQRKLKEIEVDVRIVDDDVTIKLAQKKKTNCLLIVSKALDELQLDIHHVAGGLVGDNFSFLFNTKIREGSCVYASAIANKIIEVADKQYAAT